MLAISTECPNEQDNVVLKEKIILTLFQIQRGINIVNGGIGSDMPECPTGAIGLLVRVICDEQEKMPDSEYEAADPSPANLTLALKTALDHPFTSSYEMINKAARQKYDLNSQSYKDEQKKGIKILWSKSFKPLLESGVLQEEVINDVINTGVDAWEPPFEQDNTTSFSV